ncbi:hypothetical protein D1007_12820 [Hordeum vulgare]|nr:hypothetical protein D1007_12820 [Hordeum vulgare]
MMEEGLNDSSIPKEQHTLMSAVLKSIRSIDNGLKEAFDGLLIGFKQYNSVELAEVNRKFKNFEEELDLLNKWFADAQAVSAEVEKLKGEMNKESQEATEQKAAAE